MAGSITDILSTLQNGVVAFNDLTTQMKGSFNNISGQLVNLQSSGVKSINGNTGAFTLNATTGVTLVSSSNSIILSQSSSSQFGAAKVDGSTIFASSGVLSSIAPAPITNSLGADVLLNNIANFFDGPSIAQGTAGIWWASGTVTVIDTAGAASFFVKLWDGTNVIASTGTTTSAANLGMSLTLSGFITSPAGNLRLSCRDVTSTSGKILFNGTGLSKDSTISAHRIG